MRNLFRQQQKYQTERWNLHTVDAADFACEAWLVEDVPFDGGKGLAGGGGLALPPTEIKNKKQTK